MDAVKRIVFCIIFTGATAAALNNINFTFSSDNYSSSTGDVFLSTTTDSDNPTESSPSQSTSTRPPLFSSRSTLSLLQQPPPALDDVCQATAEASCAAWNSTSEQTDRLMSAFRCFCDDQCRTFGDCCEQPTDASDMSIPDVSNALVPDTSNGSVRCIDLPFYPSPYVGMYAKTTCLDGSVCQSLPDDPFSRLPAFGNTTGHVYRNAFCALCNDEPLDELLSGEVFLSCLPGFTAIRRITGNKLRFFANTSDTSRDSDPLGVRRHCSLWYTVPQDMTSRAVKCIRTTDTCPTGTRADWTRRCEGYMQTVFNGEDQLYKNPHCAVCNGVDLDLLDYTDCNSPFRRGGASGFDVISSGPVNPIQGTTLFDPRYVPGYSLTIILDLNLGDGNRVGATKRCPEGQVFDPWLEYCRQVHCNGGRKFSEGRCQLSRSLQTTGTGPAGTNGTIILVNATTVTGTNYGSGETVVPTDASNETVDTEKPTSTWTDHDATRDGCPEIGFLPEQYQIIGTSLFVNSSGSWFNLSDVRFNGSIASVCLPQEYDQYITIFSEAEIILSIVCYALSLICLGTHFSMYILAGKYRLVPDLNMLSISFAIFLVQIFFLTAPLAQRYLLLDSVFCAVSGIFLHYFILCSFTWSTVIAYDITKSVLSLEHPSFATVTYSNYVRYSLFAWLAPTVPVITGLIFDATLPDSDYAPVYGKNVCYVGRRKALWAFFGAPVALLLTINLVFYVVTATALCRSYRRRRAMKTSNDKAVQSPGTQYRLYLKLAMIMGLAWFTAFMGIWVPAMRYVSIVANGLQGVYIFWAFSCKKSMVTAVSQRRSVFGRFSSLGSKKSSLSNVSSLSTGKLTGKTSASKSTTSLEMVGPKGYAVEKGAPMRNEQYFLETLHPVTP